jgi:hypothetical protein
MAISIKRFNWSSTPPAWKQNAIWNERRKALRADFEQANSTAANAFQSAQTNFYTGLATLAAQASIKNSEAALTAKRAQVSKLV